MVSGYIPPPTGGRRQEEPAAAQQYPAGTDYDNLQYTLPPAVGASVAQCSRDPAPEGPFGKDLYLITPAS